MITTVRRSTGPNGIAGRHSDPRATTRYDRARRNLNRHPNCNPAA
ncbi:hypothetical protein [Micromonospora okii]|nr:hypothetical protein [Micromonospora okii]